MSAGPALVVRMGMASASDVHFNYRSASSVTALLIGRAVETVADLLGNLFAICPAAQQMAANLAIVAAQGETLSPAATERLERANRLEVVREHCLRILLGWATALQETPDRQTASDIIAATRSGRTGEVVTLIQEKLFGCTVADWLGMEDGAALLRWAEAGETVAARWIDQVSRQFALPHSPDLPSTTLLCRHAAHPLFWGLQMGSPASHHVARLVNLALLTEHLGNGRGWLPGATCKQEAPGKGRATVPCSRGSVTHRVAVAGGQVAEYEIQSPTDLAFSEGGYGRDWLRQIMALAPPARENAARQIMHALDPCVEYRLEFA